MALLEGKIALITGTAGVGSGLVHHRRGRGGIDFLVT